MKIIDIRKLSTTELTKQVSSHRDEIVELKRRLALGELTNVRLIRQKRKDLARMLSVLGEQLDKEAK